MPNLSVLDGWWAEAWDGTNGWAVGDAREGVDEGSRDAADAESLYWLLETQVVPLYYERDADGLPRGWLRVMKRAIRTVAPRFSARRMVKEYVERLYAPAAMMRATLAALLVLAPAVGLAQMQRGQRMGSGAPGEMAPERGPVEDLEDPSWEALAEAGNRAYGDGQYDKAEAAYRRAAEVVQRTTPRDWRIVIVLTNLGDVIRTRGRSAEAEALYRQALVSAEGLRSADHLDLLDPLKTLGWFYHEQHRYSEAEAIFTRILRIEVRDSSARDRVRQAAYVNILAELAEFQGRYVAAERHHLETIRVLGGPDPLSRAALGTTLTQLSLLLRVQGKATESVDIASKAFQVLARSGPEGEATIRLAIRSREETVGPGHPGVARMLQPLAFLLEAQGRYSDAAVVWRRAIEILEQARPPASLDVAASLEAYAAFLGKLGWGSEARSAEARAAAIRGR